MEIYLPIAETPVNALMILGIGTLIGFLSGLLGVGGGFLMTPILFFIGIPPAIAVATSANQILGTSVSGVLAHWRRGNVDVKMGLVLLAGGIGGSSLGVWLFTILRGRGQIDLVIQLAYLVFLGVIGLLMLAESVRAWFRARRRGPPKRHHHYWLHGLPLKMRFRKSRLYISVLPALVVGFLVGVLTAIMGVGGGFIMIPAMIYLLGVPTAVVVGTSLFQIVFVTANVTVLHAVNTRTVDIVLAFLLLVGAVIGAQWGARAAAKLKGEVLRTLLGLLVMTVCSKIAFDLVAIPVDLYSLTIGTVMP